MADDEIPETSTHLLLECSSFTWHCLSIVCGFSGYIVFNILWHWGLISLDETTISFYAILLNKSLLTESLSLFELRANAAKLGLVSAASGRDTWTKVKN